MEDAAGSSLGTREGDGHGAQVDGSSNLDQRFRPFGDQGRL